MGLNWTKITNIGTKLNIKHWLWHVARCWVDTWTFLKNSKKKFKKIQKKSKKSKKPRSDTWQSLFMVVNDLNGVSKKGPNWTKLTKIRTYLNTTKIMTYLTKFDENWDQKGILTYNFCNVRRSRLTHVLVWPPSLIKISLMALITHIANFLLRCSLYGTLSNRMDFPI